MSQHANHEDLTTNELGLNKSHQLLLHILWAKKTITLPELESTHKKILQKYGVNPTSSNSLDSYVKKLNDALKPLSFAIYRDKFDGIGIVYSIVNTKKDEVMTAEIHRLEVEVFNILFDTFKNEDAALALHKVVQIVKNHPKIKTDYAKSTQAEIEACILSLIEQEFLAKVENNIQLGNRSRLELKNYFES